MDPDYAQAYAAIGITCLYEYLNAWNNLDPSSLDRGEEFAHRTLDLDPSNAIGHFGIALANFYRGRSREAIAAAERAIELLPNEENFLGILGAMLARDGQIVSALQAIKRAMRLNPRAPSTVLISVAYVNLAAGRRQEAAELWERLRLSDPDSILVRVSLAAMHEYEGRHEEARVAAPEALQVNPDLTAEIATRMTPGLEQVYGAEEAAQFEDNLRKVGLP